MAVFADVEDPLVELEGLVVGLELTSEVLDVPVEYYVTVGFVEILAEGPLRLLYGTGFTKIGFSPV
jgi:hypothetical protein